MSDILTRIATALDTFEQMVVTAEYNMEKGAGMVKVKGCVSSLLAGMDSITWEELSTAISMAPEGLQDSLSAMIGHAQQVGAYVGKVPGMDRAEGDELARKAESLVVNAWLEDEQEIERVEKLLARWIATAPTPTRVRSTRSSSANGDGEATRKATLGFTMEMVCTEHSWTGRDSTDVNSARSCVLKHMDKAHGGKVAKDNPIWQQITGALKAVAEGAQESAGAFVKVKRAA